MIGPGSIVSAAGSLFSGIFGGLASFEAASGYEDAAKFAGKSADLTATSTRIQVAQKQREVYGVLGGQRADIAASGGFASGSALDIIRDSAQQASLSKSLITHQGLITELGFKAQESAYESQASAARMQGIGQIAGGVFGAAAAVIGG